MGNQMLREGKGCWRRKPESNRRTRICNPLHNHSAIAPALEKGSADGRCFLLYLERETSLELATSTCKVALYQLSYSRVCIAAI